jgi:hypothetical protein
MQVARFMLGMLVALAVLAGIGTMTVSAQEAGGTNPANALYITNESQSIPGLTMRYYKFEYAGDNSEVVVSILNGWDKNIAFNVYTPEQINDSTWWLLPPIGRGTRHNQTDLAWVGRFYAPGPYYVEVQNFSDQPQEFTLTVRGVSVRLCPVSLDPCPPMTLIPNPQ